MRVNLVNPLPFLVAATLLAGGVFSSDIAVRESASFDRSSQDNALRYSTNERLRETRYEDDHVHPDAIPKRLPRAFRPPFRGGGTPGSHRNPFGGGDPHPAPRPDQSYNQQNNFFPPHVQYIRPPRAGPRPEPHVRGDWGFFQAEGAKTMRWFEQVRTSGQQDRGPVNWQAGYNYKMHKPEPIRFTSTVEDVLSTEFKIEPDVKYTKVVHWSKDDHRKEPIPIYNNAYSKEKKMIIALDNANQRDETPVNLKRSLNGITWDTWKEIAGPEAGQLRLFMQDQISNKDTLKLMALAHERHGIPISEKGEFHFYGADQKMQQSFEALSGSDNVRGIITMFAYHHNELGGGQVQSIRTFPEDAKIVVVLSRPEQRRDIPHIEKGPHSSPRARLA